MNPDLDSLAAALDRSANDIAGRYDFSEGTRVEPLSESENKVYLVSHPDRAERQVIRINSGRLAYHRPSSIEAEMLWMMALRRDTDIEVPEVLEARDGSLVQTVDTPGLDKPRHATVYSFLDGVEPSEDVLVPGFHRLGEISARMHRHAMTWDPPEGFARHSWTPDVILDDRLDWGAWQAAVREQPEALDLLTRLDEALRERLSSLPRDRERFGLIHADLRLANLLDDGRRTAIIDFDDCGFGWYLFDLAAALSFLEERPDVPELVASWLDGYRKVATVPANLEAEIPALIMLRRLQLLGWVGYQRHRIDFAREIAPRFVTDTCRLAEDYLSRRG